MPLRAEPKRSKLCARCERPESRKYSKKGNLIEYEVPNGCGELQHEPGYGMLCYECWGASTLKETTP
mgnify:FL=1